MRAAREPAGPAPEGAGRLARLASPAVALALLATALLASSAFWLTLRPPLQDLPQHLATARVLLDPGHPGFAFEEHFERDWLRSQYLGTYVLLGAFYFPLRLVVDEPLLWAARGLLVLLALAWPLSMELVYRQLTRRAGLGAFALVAFFNVHLILGFINFLLGIVACFLALGCLAAARARRREGRALGALPLGWGLASFACFYLHVVPFALLLAVAGLAFAEELWRALGRRPERRSAAVGWLRSPQTIFWLALSPALLGALVWLGTPAGASTREAAAGAGARGRAVYASFEQNRAELEGWLLDAFTSGWDTRAGELALALLAGWAALELAARLVAWRRARPAPAAGGDPLLLWALRALAPLCLGAYFVLPSAYDWIWPINARFPLLGALLLPLWLPVAMRSAPRALSALRALAVAGALGLAASQAWTAREAFAGFSREARGLSELIESLPPGQRTATLVFQRGSRHVRFAPFLHVGAYYQAQRGGVSVFSFADFPQSPIRFREGRRPPRVRPRWEWMPERVRERDLAWFDFVITRGGPGRVARSTMFEDAGRFGRFRLFRRRAPGQRAEPRSALGDAPERARP